MGSPSLIESLCEACSRNSRGPTRRGPPEAERWTRAGLARPDPPPTSRRNPAASRIGSAPARRLVAALQFHPPPALAQRHFVEVPVLWACDARPPRYAAPLQNLPCGTRQRGFTVLEGDPVMGAHERGDGRLFAAVGLEVQLGPDRHIHHVEVERLLASSAHSPGRGASPRPQPRPAG